MDKEQKELVRKTTKKAPTQKQNSQKEKFGHAAYKKETVEREGVSTSFFKLGESKVELLEATRTESPIAQFIEKRGEGLHHVAFAVDDIRAEMTRLREAGFRLLHEEPVPGADGKIICFLHPKSTNGILVELCQDAPAAE